MALTKATFAMIEGAWAYPEDYGAVGDNVADDTAALQALFTANKYVNLGDSSKIYKIFGKITPQSGTTVVAGGAAIRQTKNLTEIFNVENKSNLHFSGVYFIGVGTDFVNNDSNPYAAAIFGLTAISDLVVDDCKFYNFGHAGIKLQNASNVKVTNSTFVGPGAAVLTPVTDGANYGICPDTGCKNVLIANNSIKEFAQGLRIEGTEDLTVSGNVITNIIGQHGMYIGSQMKRVSVTGNVIRDVDLIGIKVQAQNTGVKNDDIAITSNTISGCGGDGIAVLNATDITVQPIQNFNVTVTGNVINDVAAYGIAIQNTNVCTVSSNVINVCGGSGISVSASTFLNIDNNVITGAQYSGIRDFSACTNVSVSGNILHNCAAGDNAGDNFGIFFQSGVALNLVNNYITDAAGGMLHGIYVAGGDQASQAIFGNQIFNSSAQAIRFASTSTALALYKDNVLIGTSGASTNNPLTPQIASASTISIPTAHDVVTVTGTTGITSVNAAGHTGHVVTLIFADAVAVTDGSNLKLAGNFTSSADDTLTLACDGTNWHEVARSAN